MTNYRKESQDQMTKLQSKFSNYKHNTRSSRNENECKKVTFENTTTKFLTVTTPANSHSNESASIKSASSSANHATNTESSNANKYKTTTFENPTTNAELLTQPDQEMENGYHKLVSTGTTRPLLKKYRNPIKSSISGVGPPGGEGVRRQ